MSLKITFVNPNSEDAVDKYLPKILASAIINKVNREINDKTSDDDIGYDVRHSA